MIMRVTSAEIADTYSRSRQPLAVRFAAAPGALPFFLKRTLLRLYFSDLNNMEALVYTFF
jgi:hypothetical protein